MAGVTEAGRLAPLVTATMASQALLVVLAPTLVAIADDLGVPVGVVGQARSITAAVAVVAAIALSSRVSLGLSRVLAFGAGLAILACVAVSAAPTLPMFLAAHVLVGLAFAGLLSAGFAGVAAFPGERRPRAMGWVAGANALAWIVVSPVVGLVTDQLSWRAAEAVPAVIALAALAMAPRAAAVHRGSGAVGLRALLAVPSARRWIGAELIAYGAWAALLTFAGAYYVQQFAVRESTAGWLLAAGAAAYFVAAPRSGLLVERLPRRPLVVGSAAAMAVPATLVFQFGGALAIAVLAFCLAGLTAGIRTPVSSGLALEQLPEQPAAMMAARTAVTQLGYLLGAAVGGALIAGAGYEAFGLVLGVGLVCSALLMLRVNEPVRTPQADATPHSATEVGK